MPFAFCLTTLRKYILADLVAQGDTPWVAKIVLLAHFP